MSIFLYFAELSSNSYFLSHCLTSSHHGVSKCSFSFLLRMGHIFFALLKFSDHCFILDNVNINVVYTHDSLTTFFCHVLIFFWLDSNSALTKPAMGGVLSLVL